MADLDSLLLLEVGDELLLEDGSGGYGLESASEVVAGLTGILFPKDGMPTNEARFETFIAATGITRSGDLNTDYRRALCSLLSIADENSVSIDDVFKRYFESL